MKTPLLMEATSTANPADTGKVTRGMLRDRALELAGLDGRAPQDASKSDWEQAKQELMTPDTVLHEEEDPGDDEMDVSDLRSLPTTIVPEAA